MRQCDCRKSRGPVHSAKVRSVDPVFPATLAREFNVVTNAQFYWAEVEPQPGVFDFSGADNVTAFARANGQLQRCHNLVWTQVRTDAIPHPRCRGARVGRRLPSPMYTAPDRCWLPARAAREPTHRRCRPT